jgi:hypothetical protein
MLEIASLFGRVATVTVARDGISSYGIKSTSSVPSDRAVTLSLSKRPGFR